LCAQAPENFRGEPYSHLVDQYSFGAWRVPAHTFGKRTRQWHAWRARAL